MACLYLTMNCFCADYAKRKPFAFVSKAKEREIIIMSF